MGTRNSCLYLHVHVSPGAGWGTVLCSFALCLSRPVRHVVPLSLRVTCMRTCQEQEERAEAGMCEFMTGFGSWGLLTYLVRQHFKTLLQTAQGDLPWAQTEQDALPTQQQRKQ